jgi:glycosyltransferase involved in cell wall biosynthesis
VCSDNPIFREVTKGNALFARPEDPVSLAEKLSELAKDPVRAASMGRRSRSIAEQSYHVIHVVEQIEKAYADAAA